MFLFLFFNFKKKYILSDMRGPALESWPLTRLFQPCFFARSRTFADTVPVCELASGLVHVGVVERERVHRQRRHRLDQRDYSSFTSFVKYFSRERFRLEGKCPNFGQGVNTHGTLPITRCTTLSCYTH